METRIDWSHGVFRLENAVLPPPMRRYRGKLYAGLLIGCLLLAAGVFYYFIFIAPYVSTDDAFIDGYVTMISSRVPGQITELRVTDNQAVKAGDVLAEIDPRDYQAKLAQARADWAAARSQWGQAQAQVKVSEAKVAEAQAAVAAAEAENRRATNDLARYQSVESRAISRSAFDAAEAQAREAGAHLDAATSLSTTADAEVALSRAGVAAADAAVQQAETRVQEAELNLSYTAIVAPRDGRVTARTVQLGNYVQPGQMLLTVVPPEMWVVANFKETQLRRMRAGQPVSLRLDAYPDHEFKGTVDSFQTGTGARFCLLPPENAVGNYVKVVQRLPVKIVFNEPLPADLDIAPGMSVTPAVKVK